jgi:hypothetical protein
VAVTDGRRLIKATWADEDLRPEYPPGVGNGEPVEGFETIIPTKQWDEAGKLIPKNGPKPILWHALLDETVDKAKIAMGATDCDHVRKIEGQPVDGKFPKYDDVIPDYTVGEDAVEIGVNPKLFAEVLKVVEAIGTEATVVQTPVNLTGERDWRTIRKGDETPIQVATAACRACATFLRAFDADKDVREQELRNAYDQSLDVVERTEKWHCWLQREDGATAVDDATPDDPAPEPAAEFEEMPQDAPTGSGGADTTPDAPDPVGDAPAAPARDPVEVESEPKRVTVRRLRTKPDDVAPVSGARCRRCGASAHRSKFSPRDRWLIVNGAAYCPVCEAAINAEGGAR